MNIKNNLFKQCNEQYLFGPVIDAEMYCDYL